MFARLTFGKKEDKCLNCDAVYRGGGGRKFCCTWNLTILLYLTSFRCLNT